MYLMHSTVFICCVIWKLLWFVVQMKLCMFQPCTESLFLALFHEFRVTLSPVLLEMIQSNHALVSPSDLNAILRKDAVYNAVGLAAFDLYDEV